MGPVCTARAPSVVGEQLVRFDTERLRQGGDAVHRDAVPGGFEFDVERPVHAGGRRDCGLGQTLALTKGPQPKSEEDAVGREIRI